MAAFFQYLYDRRIAMKWAFYGALAVIVAADFLVPRHEAHFFGDTIPAFWSLFGLIVCLALVLSWKWLSRVWLEREEDYYDK